MCFATLGVPRDSPTGIGQPRRRSSPLETILSPGRLSTGNRKSQSPLICRKET